MSLLEQELAQTRPFEDAATETILALLKSGDLVQRELQAAVAAHGLTWQQYTVLRVLRAAGPHGLPVLEIGGQLIEDCANVTRLVDRLQSKGLTERVRSQADRRVVYARLTAAGDSLLRELQGPLYQQRRRLTGSLTPTELEHLNSLLEKLRRNVYAQREAA
ncbi:MAG: MarR family transcriptional regulator [Fimbriimonadaceae bacterium]|nr:MarR family transcriptional regulator [Fimbriimonadaceae bacterium]